MIDTELTREHASEDLLERLAANYPVPRLGTALEAANLICFAASEAAGYITGSFTRRWRDLRDNSLRTGWVPRARAQVCPSRHLHRNV